MTQPDLKTRSSFVLQRLAPREQRPDKLIARIAVKNFERYWGWLGESGETVTDFELAARFNVGSETGRSAAGRALARSTASNLPLGRSDVDTLAKSIAGSLVLMRSRWLERRTPRF